MPRLPTPGGDDNTWGAILNEFLSVAHNDDGTLKIADTVAAKYTKPDDGIPESDLHANVQAKLNSTAVDDATANTKGIVQLAGDLGGTAASPTVPGLSGKLDTSAKATQQQAEGGSNNTVYMTPLSTAQAVAYHSAAAHPHASYSRIFYDNGSGYQLNSDSKVFVGPDAPTAGQSKDGDIWHQTPATE